MNADRGSFKNFTPWLTPGNAPVHPDVARRLREMWEHIRPEPICIKIPRVLLAPWNPGKFA